MQKPGYVFDRDHEWGHLTRFVQRAGQRAQLGVIGGRRRQGKTYLLQALATAAGGLYFGATQATAQRGDSDRRVPVPQPSRTGIVLYLQAKVMEPRHIERLRRAGDLLAERGYDTSTTVYACYSGAGFVNELQTLAKRDGRVVPIALGDIYPQHAAPAPASPAGQP